MKLTKRLLALALALALVLSLAACGGKDDAPDNSTNAPAAGDQNGSTPAPAEGSVYRTLYSAELTTLNYLVTGLNNEMSVCANLVDCLVEYDALPEVEKDMDRATVIRTIKLLLRLGYKIEK